MSPNARPPVIVRRCCAPRPRGCVRCGADRHTSSASSSIRASVTRRDAGWTLAGESGRRLADIPTARPIAVRRPMPVLPHQAGHAMLATRLARLPEIEKHTRCPEAALTRLERRANHSEQPRVFHRPYRHRTPRPLVVPTGCDPELLAPDLGGELLPVSRDDLVLPANASWSGLRWHRRFLSFWGVTSAASTKVRIFQCDRMNHATTMALALIGPQLRPRPSVGVDGQDSADSSLMSGSAHHLPTLSSDRCPPISGIRPSMAPNAQIEEPRRVPRLFKPQVARTTRRCSAACGN